MGLATQHTEVEAEAATLCELDGGQWEGLPETLKDHWRRVARREMGLD